MIQIIRPLLGNLTVAFLYPYQYQKYYQKLRIRTCANKSFMIQFGYQM